jgi:predicted nuclease with TOPRIM domain
VVLGKFKRWLGLVDEAEGYEREALKREYRRLERKIQRRERELEETPTAKGKKKQNPKARRIIDEVRKLRKRQSEVETRLGGPPDTGGEARRRE